MTPVDKDDFEDAELARRLAALPQPEPSAELDAAIFAKVQKDLAPGPAAANDPAAEPPRPGLLHRYRTPLAFAASLAGIAILLPVFRAMQRQEAQQVNVQVISEDAVLPAPLPKENAELAAPAAPQERKREAGIVPKRAEKPAQAEAPSTSPMPSPAPAPAAPMLAMPAPEPVPVPPPAAMEYMRAPAPVRAAPAAVPEYVAVPEPVRAAPPAVPEYAPRPAPAPEAEVAAPPAKSVTPARIAGSSIRVLPPQDWLNAIEHLLDEGESIAAAEQWKRFRQAYPDYQVPEALAERLKALK